MAPAWVTAYQRHRWPPDQPENHLAWSHIAKLHGPGYASGHDSLADPAMVQGLRQLRETGP